MEADQNTLQERLTSSSDGKDYVVDESTVCVGGRPRLTNFPATEETVRLSNSLSLGLTWSMVVVFEATSQLHPEECRRGGNYALSQDTWLSE